MRRISLNSSSKLDETNASIGTESLVSTFECDDISVEKSEDFEKPRVGLGSTANENIALRRNHRELEHLWKKKKTLGEEQQYVLKLIELYSKSVQVNYRRLTKRVGRIKSHLTQEEIKQMKNDEQKKLFADKYRQLLRNQVDSNETENCDASDESDSSALCRDKQIEKRENTRRNTAGDVCPMDVIEEEASATGEELVRASTETQNQLNDAKDKTSVATTSPSKRVSVSSVRGHTSYNLKRPPSASNSNLRQRPGTCPNPSERKEIDDSSIVMNEIIPSLEGLLDQLHNIKPQQFYENQRKLKLYDIQLLAEELETRKHKLFRGIDEIINWDKKETPEEEEARKKKEEEEEKEKKPAKRQTSFMRTVLRNFSMELMMKSMQYGWTDMGQCRYLRRRGGDQQIDPSGVNTLAKDTMKIHTHTAPPAESDEQPPDGASRPPPRDPGFDENGKMIRTADLLGLKSNDEDD